MIKRKTRGGTERQLVWMMALCSAYLTLWAFGSAFYYGELWRGLATILTSPCRLTVDYFALGGVPATLLNMGLVGFACCLVLVLSGARLSGITLLAHLLTIGLAPFGVNLLNIWPLMAGTFLYARWKREPFGNHAHLAIFSTALSPAISEALFADYGIHPVPRMLLALGLGLLIGFIMPCLAVHMLALHKGYSLFNVGLAAGFLSFVLYALFFRALGNQPLEYGLVGQGYNLFSGIFLGVLFLLFIGAGLLLGGREAVSRYRRLLSSDGYKRDYVAEFGLPAVLLNLGVFGIVVTLYYYLVGGAFTGPTFGCVLCMLCLAPLSAHPRNALPILGGYLLFSLIPATLPVNAQGILVGVSFAMGLVPIAGVYGFVPGMVAAMLHCGIVSSVPAIHGGFNMYNGGFTAGLVCLVLVPILECFFKTKAERKARRKTAVHSSP